MQHKTSRSLRSLAANIQHREREILELAAVELLAQDDFFIATKKTERKTQKQEGNQTSLNVFVP
jgi:hypothetical protein